MNATIADLLRTERLSLLEVLARLSPEEWATPSLCGGWTVQHVAAHLASAPVAGPRESAVALARSGFRVNRFIEDGAVRWSRRGRAAILGQLRDNAATGATPIGVPPEAALTDAIVHALDIRVPLDKPRAVPGEAFVASADWLLSLRWPLTIPVGGSVSRRVAGVTLVAEDAGWSHGRGPEARGSGAVLAQLLTGRAVPPGTLSGPGAAMLLHD